ncbi:MAG: carboxymuconolactone decarboxylase family protein [Desulfomonile tiedjei]|nr:carboxymuconolactone decarboxylase family protein [Desulfomonile tiedjei]
MTRLERPTKTSLSADAQRIWDKIVGPRGDVRGPYAVLMHTPDLAEKVADLGELLRFRGNLPGKERELAILTTARFLGAAFEWVMHEPFARKEGLSSETIEIIRSQASPGLLNPRERLIVEVAQSLCSSRSIPNDLYQRASEELGKAYLVELVTLVGFYGMIGCLLLSFQCDLPEGASEPF